MEKKAKNIATLACLSLLFYAILSNFTFEVDSLSYNFI